jgi:antitoxin component YwqK of YwqJK toxin-antitoxin module
MNFFYFRTILKPPVSRVIPGYFLFFIFLSCTIKKQQAAEIKIAKTIPANYFNAVDSNFVKHQDTVLYHGIYFTGYQVSLYQNGDTEFIRGYFNGVEEGLQKKWYAGKQLAEERFYINGKKEGTHKGWWPDGKQKFIFETYNNEYSGEFKEWYSSGLLGKQFHYINGEEEGSQRLWWDNGTVRANYVIRNGKKYGLIGLTVCKNPYDSIIKK